MKTAEEGSLPRMTVKSETIRLQLKTTNSYL